MPTSSKREAAAAAGGVDLGVAGPAAGDAGRVGVIDGLRVLAMLWVFYHHAYSAAGTPGLSFSAFGRTFDAFHVLRMSAGVDLFMVISGFCLFYPLVRRPGGLAGFEARRFYLKRFWRLSPAYYAAIVFVVLQPVALVLLYRALGRDADWQPLPDLWQWVTHLTYTHSLFPSTWGGINPSFWAIGLFAQLYLVFPLVVAAVRRWGLLGTLGAMAGLSIAYDLVAQPLVAGAGFETQMVVQTFFVGYWIQFAAGMAAAWVVANDRIRVHAAAAAALLVLAVGVYAAWSLLPGDWPSRSRHAALAASFGPLIVGLAYATPPVRWCFANRAVSRLAVVSFTVYLIHQPTLWYFSEFCRKELALTGGPLLVAIFTGGLAATLVTATAFYFVAERPFYRRSKRYRMTREPSPAAAPASVPAPGADRPRLPVSAGA
ncbi:MAG: acyltransferase [Planctomycetota bacterium]